MGAFRASFLIGIGAGPAIGGIVSKYYGLAAPFHFYGTTLLVAAVVAWFAMREDTPFVRAEERKSPLDALRAASRLLGDVRYVAALLATFAGWWTISGPVQIIGPIFAAKRLDFSDPQIGFALTMVSVGEALILFAAGRAADRYGRRAVLVPALAAITVSVSLLGQVESASWAFYPLLMVVGGGIASSAIAAGGLLADSVPEGGSGTAVGVNQMTGDLGYLTAPLVLGWVAQVLGFPIAYIAGAIPAALVLVMAARLPARTTPAKPEIPVSHGDPVV
jgi:MFS family permease